jgi:hypothetical protein
VNWEGLADAWIGAVHCKISLQHISDETEQRLEPRNCLAQTEITAQYNISFQLHKPLGVGPKFWTRSSGLQHQRSRL